MPVEVRQLRYFVTVADELNFTRAARRLNVVQQTLSAAITQLETLRCDFWRVWPGLAFIPVPDVPPSSIGVAWPEDGQSALVRAFVAVADQVATTGVR